MTHPVWHDWVGVGGAVCRMVTEYTAKLSLTFNLVHKNSRSLYLCKNIFLVSFFFVESSQSCFQQNVFRACAENETNMFLCMIVLLQTQKLLSPPPHRGPIGGLFLFYFFLLPFFFFSLLYVDKISIGYIIDLQCFFYLQSKSLFLYLPHRQGWVRVGSVMVP